jgi:hypothetical protein
MLYVTLGARRRKRLFDVMNGAVVTGKACRVRHLSGERGLSHMTGSAVEQHMRMVERTRAEHALPSRQTCPSEPQGRNSENGERQIAAPARNRIQALEIVQVDALREFLGAPRSARHSLVAQRHDGVHTSQNQQQDRERNVDQQPRMHPVIQPDLPVQLALLLADIREIVEDRMQRRGKRGS